MRVFLPRKTPEMVALIDNIIKITGINIVVQLQPTMVRHTVYINNKIQSIIIHVDGQINPNYYIRSIPYESVSPHEL